MPSTQNAFQQKTWLKISITTSREFADLVADLLCRLTGGVEQVADKDKELIIGYLPDAPDSQEKLSQLNDALAGLPVAAEPAFETTVKTEIIADEDWNKSWKERFRPFPITPHLVIKPSWETYQAKAGERVIELDPGMAFGTGHHASTKLALSLIEDLFHDHSPAPHTVLDVGTGTGILAMAAALFGARQVAAIDNDPEAVAIARENICRNRLESVVNSSDTPLSAIDGLFELIIANIIHDTLIELAPQLADRLRPGGKLTLAGILAGPQTENIIAHYSALGLAHKQTKNEGEWSAILFTKPQKS